MSRNDAEATEFLNVDLEVYSKSDLQPLADAMGEKVIALFVGRIKRTYHAHFEIAGLARNADATIQALCAIVRSLPRPAAKLWKSANRRDFNVGVQAALEPVSYEIALAPETVRAVSEVKAQIVLTVYAPEQTSFRRKKLSAVRP